MSVLAYPPTNEEEIFRHCTNECGIIKTTEDQQYFSLGCMTCPEKFLYFGAFVQHIQTVHVSNGSSSRKLKRLHDDSVDLAEVHRPLLESRQEEEIVIKQENYEIHGELQDARIINEPLLSNDDDNVNVCYSIKHEQSDPEISMEIGGNTSYMGDSFGSFNDEYGGVDGDGDRNNNGDDDTDFDELVEESLLDYIQNNDSKGKVEIIQKEQLYKTLQSIDNKNWEYVFELFKDHGIDEKHLMLLTSRHLSEIFPKDSIGVRIEFENNIKSWQKNKREANIGNIIIESYDVSPSMSTAALAAISANESAPITKIEKVIRKVVLKDIINRELSEAKDNYIINGTLTELDKRKLSTAIIKYFEHENIKQTSILLEDVATQINAIFPTESNEAWYCKSPGKRVKGRLVSKKYNVRRNLSKKHIAELFPKHSTEIGLELADNIKDWNTNKNKENACNIITESYDVNPSISSAALPAISKSESNQTAKIEKVVRRVILKDIIKRELSEAIDNYTINGTLTELDKRKLSSAIIRYLEHKNIKQTSTLLEDIATQINVIFPTESNESWYCKTPGKRVKGRLVSKKYNVRRNLLKKTSTRPQIINDEFVEDDSDPNDICDADFIAKRDWLKINHNNVNETLKIWGETSRRRTKDIKKNINGNLKNVIDGWPSYKLPIGQLLVEIDFKTLFPLTDKKIYERWDIFEKKIVDFYKIHIKDVKANDLLHSFLNKENSLSKDSRSAILLYLLPAIIKPSSIKTNKKVEKFTIAESQQHFIKIVNCTKDMGMYEQPYIFVVGDSLFDITNIYVTYCGISYKCESIINAISTCFHIFLVFNFKYPLQAIDVWTFVQNFFFEIYLKSDSFSSISKTLITYLKYD